MPTFAGLLCLFAVTSSWPLVGVPSPPESAATPVTVRFRTGLRIRAAGQGIRQLQGGVVVPGDWPEQQVRLVSSSVPDALDLGFRDIRHSAREMLVSAAQLGAGEEVEVALTYEIERTSIQAPEQPDLWLIPKKVPKDLGRYLRASPNIETNERALRKLHEEISDASRTPWQQAEHYYDWTRQNIRYVGGASKGARAALRDKSGDCEELTAIFIAMCRLEGIPARTVLAPGHVWAEFYLETADHEGRWFPAELTGPREFGRSTSCLPILLKGEGFRRGAAERGPNQRYLTPWVSGLGGSPQVEYISEVAKVPAAPAQTDPAEDQGGEPD